MAINTTFARNVRLARLYRHRHERLLIVPMGHSVTHGPIAEGAGVDRILARLAGNGVDAVVLHKGALRHVDHGPGATVLNSTELKPDDRVLGHLPTEDRHVGYPIAEFCKEQ